MSEKSALLLVLSLLGGLGLFIVGMQIMTDGLRCAAGGRMRSILTNATSNRAAGVGFGAALGFLIHSSAASVMTIGFVNAGLMTLGSAIPLLMGAGVGTTLSMQLISLRLTDYAFIAVAIGFLLQIVFQRPLPKNLGKAIFGFGLLFFGIDFISESIQPYRAELAPFLARIEGTTLISLLAGITIATIITGIIQSSGATIGILFALIDAGVFTTLEQAFPIILGAHIGTAATALIASAGAELDARRAALAYLLFQVFNVLMAVLLAPLFLWAIAMTSDSLVRQAANMHTAVMVAAVIILMPIIPLCARCVELITPSKAKVARRSFLDRDLLRMPERALWATMMELRRGLEVCVESFDLASGSVKDGLIGQKAAKRVQLNEEVVDEIKLAVKDYLAALAGGCLSQRQALMVQYLNQAVADIERVSDHIDNIWAIYLKQRRLDRAHFDDTTSSDLYGLMEGCRKVLDEVTTSMLPENQDFRQSAENILKLCDAYNQQSLETKETINAKVADRKLHPLVGLYFSDYVSALDRIVKHCKMMAREEQQPFFRVKLEKLDQLS